MEVWRDRSYIIFLVLALGICPTTPNSVSPVMVTEPRTVSLARGERARLECKVSHLADHQNLVWRRGYDVLATGPLLLSPDPRIAVDHKGGSSSLVISSLREGDAGEYVCQISLLGGMLAVRHNLDVLVAPSVRPVESSVTVKEGEEVTLECVVGGNPIPSIAWTKQGGPLPPAARPSCPHSSCLVLPSANRDAAGGYSCAASNGVGEPSVASLHLKVLFPPVIRVDQETVHGGPGRRLHLSCRVDGEPTPSLVWYFGENRVRPSPVTGTSLAHTGHHHSLTISSSTTDNFGNYSCVAHNSLGTFKKHIEVHGRPTDATFQREGARAGRTSFTLNWKVQSFAKILEYRLLYRSLVVQESLAAAASSDWTNVIIPGPETFQPGTQVTRWRLDNLGEETSYECLVQARNEYGWSQPSKMFTFTTSQKNVQSPATQGLNWGGPSSSASHAATSVLAALGLALLGGGR